jgi:hypothetical protein
VIDVGGEGLDPAGAVEGAGIRGLAATAQMGDQQKRAAAKSLRKKWPEVYAMGFAAPTAFNVVVAICERTPIF